MPEEESFSGWFSPHCRPLFHAAPPCRPGAAEGRVDQGCAGGFGRGGQRRKNHSGGAGPLNVTADAATDPQQAMATSLSARPRADMRLERESALQGVPVHGLY